MRACSLASNLIRQRHYLFGRNVFEEEGALDKLETFASLNGPKHYGLPPNAETITLEKRTWTVPEEIKVPGAAERALIHHGGETMTWQVAAS